MWRRIRERLGQRRGQALVEYVLVLALIALVAIGVVTTLGQTVSGQLSNIVSGIQHQ
ncbi:MAG: Flp family type IVb pilin [Firmicutes bacterium]|nr:Flp family type IVb pilin [Alicyclobacillaceae bacterium]MCL6497837.1 Flp family type IVb pilin [Bacillota bacterium]